jgi:hypothetical protein
MSRVGFEPTIAVFEREKTLHTSDRTVTLIDLCGVNRPSLYISGTHGQY